MVDNYKSSIIILFENKIKIKWKMTRPRNQEKIKPVEYYPLKPNHKFE